MSRFPQRFQWLGQAGIPLVFWVRPDQVSPLTLRFRHWATDGAPPQALPGSDFMATLSGKPLISLTLLRSSRVPWLMGRQGRGE